MLLKPLGELIEMGKIVDLMDASRRTAIDYKVVVGYALEVFVDIDHILLDRVCVVKQINGIVINIIFGY